MFKFLHHHAFRYLTLNFENENAKLWTLIESWAKMETKNKLSLTKGMMVEKLEHMTLHP